MHFSEIKSFNLKKKKKEKKRHTLLCILRFFKIIVALKLSLKNSRLPPIFSLDFNSP